MSSRPLTASSSESASTAGAPRPGDAVPVGHRVGRQPLVLTPAARKGLRQRMLLFRQNALDTIRRLTGASDADLRRYRHDLIESGLPELLLERGAGLAYTRELPQGALLYLLVRTMRPARIVETGVRPGYSTAWFLAALDANGYGDLTSLGPGPVAGRATGVRELAVGQFVAPALRTRWTLVLGNSEERLREVLDGVRGIDLFFYDNGPDPRRTHFELRSAWSALADRGVILVHHVDANSAYREFCRLQGVPEQLFDPGPPPLGALSVQRDGAR